MLLLLAVQLASLRVGCRGIEVASRNASPSISDATSHSTQSLADVAPLVQSADAAFARGEDGKGIAYLSAALVHSPGDDKALNTYRGLLRRRFEDALTARDWSRAAVAVAAYDQIIRDGLRSASTVGCRQFGRKAERSDCVARRTCLVGEYIRSASDCRVQRRTRQTRR